MFLISTQLFQETRKQVLLTVHKVPVMHLEITPPAKLIKMPLKWNRLIEKPLSVELKCKRWSATGSLGWAGSGALIPQHKTPSQSSFKNLKIRKRPHWSSSCYEISSWRFSILGWFVWFFFSFF